MKTTSMKNIKAQRGLSLVELMIGIAISLIIVLFLTAMYFGNRKSSVLQENNNRLQEEGRIAMFMIGESIMQGGYGRLISSNLSQNISKLTLTEFQGDAVKSTDGNNLIVRYNKEDNVNAAAGIGVDCAGQEVAGKVIQNEFYLKGKSLYCKGNGGDAEQIILGDERNVNVDNMVIKFGLNGKDSATDLGFYSAEDYVDVAFVGSNWNRVVSINICLELSSKENNVAHGSSFEYIDCSGEKVTATDGRLHSVMNTVYTIRNQASARNIAVR